MTKQAQEGEPVADADAAEGAPLDLVELVLLDQRAAAPDAAALPPERIDGVVVGIVVGLSETGAPLVEHPAGRVRAPLAAKSVLPVTAAEVGREVALLFEGGDPTKPLVMGLIHVPVVPVTLGETPEPLPAPVRDEPVEVTRDGERLVLTAHEQIVLQCGKASITLTRAGKILIHGAYVLARSSGVHRIQGGSVQIN